MTEESRAGQRAWIWVAVVAAVIGVLLRGRALFANRSLWLDEAMVSLNICGRSFAGLMRPLDYDQGAPIGFLWVEKLSVLALGPNELALRLFPFLASLATIALVYRFCRAHFEREGAAIGVAVIAVMPSLISYAGEAKQYAVDVAAGLLVMTLIADSLREGINARRAAVLAVVGAICVWISHPVVFILAGAGATLILKEGFHRRFGPALLGAGAAAVWLVSFAGHYLLSLKDLQTNSYLNDFWEAGFLALPPRSIKDLRQYMVIGLGIFEAPFHNTQLEENLSERMSVITAAIWLCGVGILLRRKERGLAMLLVMPLVVAALAAVAHKYPLRFRLALFTVGPVLLAGIAGLSYLIRSDDRTGRILGRVLTLCCLLLPAAQAGQFLLDRPKPYGAKTVLEEVAREWQPGDLLLVDGGSEPPFRWYQTYGRIPGLDRVTPTPTPEGLADPATLVAALPRLKGQARVWMLISAHLADRSGREAQLLRLTLDQWGERLASVNAPGYYAYLYDFHHGDMALTRNHTVTTPRGN
ncbi:glycosyltransferase family 39 protein [Singulisphaera sp. PoT]|uniref:glycosyltransferase family 39 protein n=1 Tax=Singulisphaera sp. PoT TaxID=3411797 RepID=UPI003BF46E1C